MAHPNAKRELILVGGGTCGTLYATYHVSQEGNDVSFATPAAVELLKANDGAESAILLDFINVLADNIEDEFP